MFVERGFVLGPDSIERAFSFAEDLWEKKAQSPKNFGSTAGRSKFDFIADTVEGKLAEEGFRIFLNTNFQIDTRIDYDIYPGMHEIDYGNDLQQFSVQGKPKLGIVKVDIKSAREYSEWLLIEGHKLWADIFVLATLTGLSKNWERNPYDSKNHKITVSIAGFAYFTDLIDNATKKPWFTFASGRNLVNPNSIYEIISRLRRNNSLSPSAISQSIDVGRANGTVSMMNVYLKASSNHGMPKRMLRTGHLEWEKAAKLIATANIDFPDQLIARL